MKTILNTRNYHTALAISILSVAFLAGGCSVIHQSIGLIPGLQNPSQKLVEDAFTAKDPDQRRKAIVKLTKRYDGMREPFLSAYAEFARDTEPIIRSIAINALGKAGDMKYFDVIAAALADTEVMVQTDAAKILATGKMVSPEKVPAELYSLAASHKNKQLRAACIDALANYPSPRTNAALLKCLDEDDFTIRLAARQALVKLNNTDCGYDLITWQKLMRNE